MAETEATPQTGSETSPLTNGLKGVAEVILPGSSLYMEGDIKNGTFHTVGGVVGRILLGPVGWFAAAANSYSNSVTGKHVHEHFIKPKSSPETSPEN